MRILQNGDVLEIKRETDGMEVQPADTKRIGREAAIQLAFCIGSKRLVKEQQGKSGEEQESQARGRHPWPNSM